MVHSFDPIVDENCRILILGTMPGQQSLQKQEYYGNRQNAFWRIMFTLLQEEQTEVYEEKKAFLLRHHVALWDVLEACEREGSGDAEIRNAVPHDFPWLLEQYPSIRTIYFNGGYAEKFFKQYVRKNVDVTQLEFRRLPSTSPANATVSFDKKLSQWKVITEHICFL